MVTGLQLLRVCFECFGFVARWLSTAGWQMVLTLVLLMFILVVGHDFYVQRRQARRMEAKERSARSTGRSASLFDECRGRVSRRLPTLLTTLDTRGR